MIRRWARRIFMTAILTWLKRGIQDRLALGFFRAEGHSQLAIRVHIKTVNPPTRMYTMTMTPMFGRVHLLSILIPKKVLSVLTNRSLRARKITVGTKLELAHILEPCVLNVVFYFYVFILKVISFM
jgi:hypothetical protein